MAGKLSTTSSSGGPMPNRLVLFDGICQSLALPIVCEYNLNLATSIDVPGFYPYSAQMNACSASLGRLHGIFLCVDIEETRQIFSMKDTLGQNLPLLNRKDVVSPPVRKCIPYS